MVSVKIKKNYPSINTIKTSLLSRVLVSVVMTLDIGAEILDQTV